MKENKELKKDNAKLKYRVNHLLNSLKDEEALHETWATSQYASSRRLCTALHGMALDVLSVMWCDVAQVQPGASQLPGAAFKRV